MVYVVEIDGARYYACEVCRMLYVDELTARRCEEHCRANPGVASPYAEIAVGYVNPQGEPQKVFFKISPVRGCSRLEFKICRRELKLYVSC